MKDSRAPASRSRWLLITVIVIVPVIFTWVLLRKYGGRETIIAPPSILLSESDVQQYIQTSKALKEKITKELGADSQKWDTSEVDNLMGSHVTAQGYDSLEDYKQMGMAIFCARTLAKEKKEGKKFGVNWDKKAIPQDNVTLVSKYLEDLDACLIRVN